MDHKTDVEKLETVEKASSLQHNESIAGVDTADIDQRELKKTIRRMDLITLPVLTLLLAFCFIDRANMGLAAVAGMTADLEFVGYQYSISLLVFFPGYVLNLEMRCILCCLVYSGLLLTREVVYLPVGSVHSFTYCSLAEVLRLYDLPSLSTLRAFRLTQQLHSGKDISPLLADHPVNLLWRFHTSDWTRTQLRKCCGVPRVSWNLRGRVSKHLKTPSLVYILTNGSKRLSNHHRRTRLMVPKILSRQTFGAGLLRSVSDFLFGWYPCLRFLADQRRGLPGLAVHLPPRRRNYHRRRLRRVLCHRRIPTAVEVPQSPATSDSDRSDSLQARGKRRREAHSQAHLSNSPRLAPLGFCYNVHVLYRHHLLSSILHAIDPEQTNGVQRRFESSPHHSSLLLGFHSGHRIEHMVRPSQAPITFHHLLLAERHLGRNAHEMGSKHWVAISRAFLHPRWCSRQCSDCDWFRPEQRADTH